MKDRAAQSARETRASAGSGIIRDPGPVNADRGSRQRVVLDRAGAEQALAQSRRELAAAYRQIEALKGANSHLEWELMRLAEKEAQARAFAYHDELTGLPNRRLLQDRLRQTLAQGARRHKQVALLLLDLDDFKSINDRLGHAAGDQVLRMVAERLAAGVRGADTACRYGGDEFVIMLPEVEDAGMAAAVAEKLREALSAPYVTESFAIRMTTSVGSVVYPNDGGSYFELMGKADAALYRAKATSRKASITISSTYTSQTTRAVPSAGRGHDLKAGLCAGLSTTRFSRNLT